MYIFEKIIVCDILKILDLNYYTMEQHLHHLGEKHNKNKWKDFHLHIKEQRLFFVKQGIATADTPFYDMNNPDTELIYPKYEILLRGNTPNGSGKGTDTPMNLQSFLQQVEFNNFEFNLDITLLEKVFIKIAEEYNEDPRYDNSSFNINVYPATFCDKYFHEFLKYVIAKTKVRTDNIVLEILESGRSFDEMCKGKYNEEQLNKISYSTVNQNIKDIKKEHGMQIALDDYGNGNNNTKLLEFLKGFDIVKLDGGYLDEELEKLGEENFVKVLNLIMMHLKRKGTKEIVFEKVSSEEKLKVLQRIDTRGMETFYQGWLFSVPTVL